MKRLLLIFLLIPLKANAIPCQAASFYDGWASSFFNTKIVTGFNYGLAETYMYVMLDSNTVTGFIHVPFGTAQTFANSRTPDSFYTGSVLTRYPRPLMSEDCKNILTQADNYLLAYGSGTVATANSTKQGQIINGQLNGETIISLPQAKPTVGNELIPILQNGQVRQLVISFLQPMTSDVLLETQDFNVITTETGQGLIVTP